MPYVLLAVAGVSIVAVRKMNRAIRREIDGIGERLVRSVTEREGS